MSYERKKVLVLGAGYAGLSAVSKLQKIIGVQEADITLINKNEYHYEATWLHETAAGSMNWEEGVYPIAKVVDNMRVRFIPAEVTKIDRDAQVVETTQGEFSFDTLVVALGFESESFGIKGMDEFATTIVSPETAVRTREEIEQNFINYKTSKDPKDLSILVGGAGFTGVEFLGELVETLPELCKVHGIDYNQVKITCVEAMPTMLPMFSEELTQHAVNFLESRGVEFMLGTAIVAANENGFVVKVNDEEKQLEASSVVWTAGVRGSRLMEESFEGVKRGRIVVKDDLTVDGYPNIFAIGDVAAVMNGTGENARPYPTTAQIAMQLGEHTAKNIKLKLNGEKMEPFAYDDKGTVCSLGTKDGIGVVLGREIKGKPAAFMKKVIDTRAVLKIGGAVLGVTKGKFL
ncbi:NAD(P)/FAD-dependent oxidoreductase [Jeotgalicoccus nanhaiensis]|jgi:NADH dehydrogenase, FAD-containing subunit|uniref:Type II NADH:quinone oxidoreductase n=1 Tax=Jeotgalicoccus nanhaiensis TaxID=568603 RepID=A0ABR9XVL1_9STAP|nr:NAD(P)/FAD-dependent oxidoreductase [Jeotgalicoccus nanhaiensis]MBF0752927.1 NAD(P)/FAD-dependent oxidoreductase [Jeotgalicoccus nanhaiensis]TFU63083.1 NAD(P)/FAD-dependent oxidoreductase [Jeotgalicoccus nanhaiensis]